MLLATQPDLFHLLSPAPPPMPPAPVPPKEKALWLSVSAFVLVHLSSSVPFPASPGVCPFSTPLAHEAPVPQGPALSALPLASVVPKLPPALGSKFLSRQLSRGGLVEC